MLRTSCGRFRCGVPFSDGPSTSCASPWQGYDLPGQLPFIIFYRKSLLPGRRHFPWILSVLVPSDLRSTVVEALAAHRESRKRRVLPRKRCQGVRSTSRMSSVTFYNHPGSIRALAASWGGSNPEVAIWVISCTCPVRESKMTAYIILENTSESFPSNRHINTP